jgi:hypothetical protein
VSGTRLLDCERTWLAAALASPAPVTVLTSDPEDLEMLCGPGTRVIKV